MTTRTRPATRVTLPAMTEDELLGSVLDLAQHLGILVHHGRPARTADGRWRTPIRGDKGLPDLILAGARGVLYRELKSTSGRLTPEQVRWIDRLTAAGADAAVWRPTDWPARICDELEAIR